jgi:hypothetical protein
MMTITDKSANIEFTLKEFTRLHILVSDKQTQLEDNLSNCDSHDWLEVMQLQAKLEGILALIHKKIDERKIKTQIEKDTEDEIMRLRIKELSSVTIEAE